MLLKINGTLEICLSRKIVILDVKYCEIKDDLYCKVNLN